MEDMFGRMGWIALEFFIAIPSSLICGCFFGAIACFFTKKGWFKFDYPKNTHIMENDAPEGELFVFIGFAFVS